MKYLSIDERRDAAWKVIDATAAEIQSLNRQSNKKGLPREKAKELQRKADEKYQLWLKTILNANEEGLISV